MCVVCCAVQVLRFEDAVERGVFVSAIKDMLKVHGKPLLQHESSTKMIYDKAITKVKRQHMLTQFFRSVFAEVKILYIWQCTKKNEPAYFFLYLHVQ
jgi:hypothetical protein